MSNPEDLELLRQVAKKALQKDHLNIISQVNDGKPLTDSQRRRLERISGWVDKADLLEALEIIKESACETCLPMIVTLMENIEDEPESRPETEEREME